MVQLRQFSSRAHQLSWKSSATQLRTCYTGVNSAQTFSPLGLSARSPATQNDELNQSAQAMQPKRRFNSGNSAHEPTSSVGRAQPPNLGRVTQESIQLRRSAHFASTPGAQQLRMTSSTILHSPCSLGVNSAQAIRLTSPPTQLEELSHPTHDVLLRSQFSSDVQPTRPQRPEPRSSE